MLTCALSGVIPEEAVISRKTGHIYERRLIEKHLKQTNTCPITNQEMTVDDLMPVANNGKVVKPRPPTATSLPALLSLFASEWDSLMLETYNLKKQLESTRQELAHSLYQHDAACRVIARLIKERDQARAGLTASQSNAGAALNPPSASSSMDVDSKEALGIASVEDRLVATASALTGDRKKRVKAAVASVASREALAKYAQTESHPLHSTSAPGINAVDVHSVKQDMIVTGGNDSNAIVFNRSTGKIVHTLKGHSKKITDVRFHTTNDRVVLTASHDNTAIVWKGDEDLKYTAQHTIRAHSGPLCGVSIHPSGDFFITGSADKTWAFHDIETGITRQTISDDKQTAGYTRVQFHPDGLLLGAATEDALVRIYDIKAQKTAATFKGHSGKVHGLSFSENGYYLATGDDSGTVKIWDLRKLLNIQTFVVPDIHSIASLVFDASGSYLGVAGANVTVYGTKDWDVVATYREHKDIVTDLKFGRDARFIASVSKDRTLKFAA